MQSHLIIIEHKMIWHKYKLNSSKKYKLNLTKIRVQGPLLIDKPTKLSYKNLLLDSRGSLWTWIDLS